MEWKQLMIKAPSRDKVRQIVERENPDITDEDIDMLIEFFRFLTMSAIEHYLKNQ